MTQYTIDNVLITCEYYFDSDTSTSLRSDRGGICFHLSRFSFFTNRIASKINYLKNSFQCFDSSSHLSTYDGSCVTCNLPEIEELSKILNNSFSSINSLEFILRNKNFSLEAFEEKYNEASDSAKTLQDTTNTINENVINTIFDNKFYQYHLLRKAFSTLTFGLFPAYSNSVIAEILQDLSLIKEDLLYLDKYL